jgi:hypothetical protein
LASRQQLPSAFQQLLVPHVYAALAPWSSRNAQPRQPKKTAWRTIMVRKKRRAILSKMTQLDAMRSVLGFI